LFETNSEINLELEDEVRLQLFIDNLRLHKIHNESICSNKQESNNISKYLRKNFKILLEWQADQSNSLGYIKRANIFLKLFYFYY